MSKRHYVYSTLTADNIYAVYEKGGGDLPRRKAQVLIKGGSNIADRRLVTPRGVATEVSQADLDLLLANKSFLKHVERGFITFSEHREDPEKVVATEGLETRDASAPLEPGDFEAGAETPGATPMELAPAEISQPAAMAAPSHPARANKNRRRA